MDRTTHMYMKKKNEELALVTKQYAGSVLQLHLEVGTQDK